MDEETWTTSNYTAPPITLQSLQEIMLRFEDRMPACPVAVRVGDADLFKANLREEGFQKSVGAQPIFDIPIVVDETMAPNSWKLIYK